MTDIAAVSSPVAPLPSTTLRRTLKSPHGLRGVERNSVTRDGERALGVWSPAEFR